jgi:hypothetical protein
MLALLVVGVTHVDHPSRRLIRLLLIRHYSLIFAKGLTAREQSTARSARRRRRTLHAGGGLEFGAVQR